MMRRDWLALAGGLLLGLSFLVSLVAFLPVKSPAQTVEITRSPYINCGNPPGSVSMGCAAPSATLTIPIAPYNDGTDLGRAMAICQQHRDWYSPQSILEPILYQQEWDACRTIHDRWGRSEAAKRFREQLVQEKFDKAFVETIANSGD